MMHDRRILEHNPDTPENVVHPGVLEDIYSSYFPASPVDPTHELHADRSPASEWSSACQDGEHGAQGLAPSFDFSRAPLDAPVTPQPHVTLRMPTSSEYRACSIVRRAASRSLPSSPDSPPPQKTFIWAPTEFEWRLINSMDWGSLSKTGEDAESSESPDQIEPLRPTMPLLRRKGHIRRASEPPNPKYDTQPRLPSPLCPFPDYSNHLTPDLEANSLEVYDHLTPDLETNSLEPSPLSPSFKFPGTPSNGSFFGEVERRLFIQILGASGLPQTGVLKRSPKPYADIAIGGQAFRTSTSDRRTTAPVWNNGFLFDSIKDTDSVLIRIWGEAGPNAQRTWLGSFMCTVRRLLLMQAVNDVLTLTLDRWPNEGHILESTQCGSIDICIKDLTVPSTRDAYRPLMPVTNTPRHGTEIRHHKYPSSPSILQTTFDTGLDTLPGTPFIVLPDEDEPVISRSLLTQNSDIRPSWVGEVIGRTLSLSRGKYPWVPTGDITIKAGPVAAGGHCDVYLGDLRREGTNAEVALKQLRVFINASDNMKKMFRREVQFWSQLRHPNVLPFWGCYELDEYRLFMISPWAVNGNSLRYVQKNPNADRRRILKQTAEALAYLHSGEDGDALVHGDLKADNVLISETGDALLADFGLTRYVEKLASISGTPSGVSPHGHIRFSAPELLHPPSGEDPRPTPESDVFAFACFTIQLYTEEMPFSEIKRDVQVLTEIVRGARPSRPSGAATDRGLDDDLWSLANECWRLMAILRPSMSQVADRL